MPRKKISYGLLTVMKQRLLRNTRINNIDIKTHSEYRDGYKVVNNGLKKDYLM